MSHDVAHAGSTGAPSPEFGLMHRMSARGSRKRSCDGGPRVELGTHRRSKRISRSASFSSRRNRFGCTRWSMDTSTCGNAQSNPLARSKRTVALFDGTQEMPLWPMLVTWLIDWDRPSRRCAAALLNWPQVRRASPWLISADTAESLAKRTARAAGRSHARRPASLATFPRRTDRFPTSPRCYHTHNGRRFFAPVIEWWIEVNSASGRGSTPCSLNCTTDQSSRCLIEIDADAIC